MKRTKLYAFYKPNLNSNIGNQLNCKTGFVFKQYTVKSVKCDQIKPKGIEIVSHFIVVVLYFAFAL